MKDPADLEDGRRKANKETIRGLTDTKGADTAQCELKTAEEGVFWISEWYCPQRKMERIISNGNRPEASPPELWGSVFINYPVYRILLALLGRMRK